MFPLLVSDLDFFVMALAAAHAWSDHHQKLLGIRRLGGPEVFTIGDSQVRRPMASHFDKGVDFGLIIHRSPFMVQEKDPLVLNNYIFELLKVNPRVAGFLIQLHAEDVEAVVEFVTAHAEKGVGTKTTLHGMGCSKAWCGTPPDLGVVNMVGTWSFTCCMAAL